MENRRELFAQLKIFFGVIALLGAMIVLLKIDVVKRTQSARAARADIASALGASDATAILKRDAAAALPFIPVVENLLPAQDKLVVFANDVKNIAAQYKVSADVRFKNETESGNAALRSTTVSIDIQGNLLSVMDFINALKHSKYFLKTNSVDILRASDNNVRASLSGTVFSIVNQK